MNIQNIIDDVESLFLESSEIKEYGVAFASYDESDSGEITIEAFIMDDDEFHLIPEGVAKVYNLIGSEFKAYEFLNKIKTDLSDIVFTESAAFAKARTKILEDGRVVSLNSPLWGTGVHDDAKLVYFYHGKMPK